MTVAYNPDRHFRMQFTKPQSDFILSEAEFPLFVGGFGSGKSTTMAANVVYDLISFPGANIGCYSPTFDLLSLITVPYVGEILEGLNLKYNYHGGRNMFIVEGYGNIICRSLNNPARIVGYQVFQIPY
jgi:phage terminase large subunit